MKLQLSYRVITITGIPCSGATTLAVKLSGVLDWPFRNPGSELGRAYLEKHGLPLSAMNSIPDEDERKHDTMAKEAIVHQRQVIIGGRLAGWLAQGMPDVFKIFVTADKEIRITRFAQRERFPLDKARAELEKREQEEQAKYLRLYNANHFDHKLYDLVIDTTQKDAKSTLETVLTSLGLSLSVQTA